MNTIYEMHVHLVCNLYDESTVLVEKIFAETDEEAIRIAEEAIEQNGMRENENITWILLAKDNTVITKLK